MRYKEGTQRETKTKARTEYLRGLNLELQVVPSTRSSKDIGSLAVSSLQAKQQAFI